jgi:DNA-binding transcriptional LysR family regulator
MKITLRQLAVFDAVARLGSVSKAAEEVHLSQSATTLALQDLERSLDVSLFYRHQRKVTLNENGRRLQPQARSMLTLARDIEGDGDVAAGGVLHVASSPVIGNYLMSTVCTKFLSAHPKARIKLTVADDPIVIEQVEEMTIDMGFIEGVSFRPTLTVQPWIKDELVFVVSPCHWAADKCVEISELKSEGWHLTPRGTPTQQQLVQNHPALLKADSIRFESTSIEALKASVATGKGISCLSRCAVAQELKAGILKQVHARGFQIRREFKILSRKDIYHGGLHSAFVKHALALVGEHINSDVTP